MKISEIITERKQASHKVKYTREWPFVADALSEGPKDFDNMNLDQKGKQDSIDYFYHTHAPTFGKPTKAGSFKEDTVLLLLKRLKVC